MERTLTDLEFTLLGLLAEQPRHGYDIEQTIEARDIRDWAQIGFSSIYYALDKLARRKLVRSERVMAAGRGPARKVYQLTDDGWGAFREQLRATLSTPQNAYSPFLIGLANLPALAPADQVATLQSYRAAQTETRKSVAARQAAMPPGVPAHVHAMFTFSIALIDAELSWLDDFIQQLTERKQP